MFQGFAYSHIAMCVAMTMFALLSGFCSRPLRITVDEVNQRIVKEVPVGSSTSQVEKFLDEQKITHSGYLEDLERESDYRESDLGGKKSLVKGYIGAIIRDVDPNTWWNATRWDIQIYFYFDGNGKLVHHTTRGVGTSL
ncbi:MAG: hypothetical protein MSG64_20370 [Pyrinomonadaceae bacterium MAG19_C2-C3]|nr:hypothetical protein [Pyrinomonadaceae bacterium MAG19_C2-C3]